MASQDAFNIFYLVFWHVVLFCFGLDLEYCCIQTLWSLCDHFFDSKRLLKSDLYHWSFDLCLLIIIKVNLPHSRSWSYASKIADSLESFKMCWEKLGVEIVIFFYSLDCQKTEDFNFCVPMQTSKKESATPFIRSSTSASRLAHMTYNNPNPNIHISA